MAGPGGGPCRRSHTKSRKGCKTCKKRHIRCDETFPQCRNCTKHQVRCDYMDSPTIISPTSPKSPRQPNLLWTAEIEATIDLWRQTGEFPFPELRVYPQPQWHIMSKTDLRLIHHLSSIANEMFRSNTSKMTVWADMMPKFLGLAASHPFVMHSILAFSASHIAWIAQSTETRSLAVHHGGLAWKGLHEALPTYSKQNSDAVLAASLLLAWQATDWRGWAQLVTDTQMIISTMQPWRNESVFAEYIAEHGVLRQNFNSAASALITPDARRDHLQTLQSISHSLQRLQPYLMRHEQESKWIDQLRSHIDRLKTFNPPQTSEEQFQQLYPLRKWLFWVPISLLSTRRGDVIVMTVLAHFYATTLALEPLFPDIGGAFCANLALPPLEEIIHIIGSLQSSPGYTPTAQAALVLMDFPRDIAQSYRTSRDWVKQQADDYQHSPYTMETFNFDPQTHMAPYSYGASLSPMFASSPLSYVPPTMISGQSSPYLEVPRSSIDFGTINFSTYSTTPLVSPVAPPIAYTQEESALHFGMPTVGFPGGFVAPAIWT